MPSFPTTELGLRLRGGTAFHAMVALALCLAGAGCSDKGGDGGVTNPPGGNNNGTFSLALSASTVSFAQSGSTTLTVTITRAAGFTNSVALTATGLPTGVTASFVPAIVAVGVTTSTVTLTASATATAGLATITIKGTANGATDQTVTAQLTVTATSGGTGPFAIALSVTSFLALPPTNISASPILTVTRNPGFTGSVAFTVTGLPATLFIGFAPSSTTGNSTSLLILNAGAPNGSYVGTIHVTGAGGVGERTVPIQIVVASPTTGSITWRFCENGVRLPQYFFAVKDGSGPWLRITPNGLAFSFNVTQASAQVALVTVDSGGYRTTVYQATAQEIAARAATECALYAGVSTRSANGSVGNLIGGELSLVSMGWWSGSSAGPGVGSYNLLNLPAGPLDLLAVRGVGDLQGNLNLSRAVLRRALNPASGAANLPIDFNSAEAFAPTSATLTFANSNGQPFGVTTSFITAGGTVGILQAVPGIDNLATVRSMSTIPAARSIAGDLHQLIATVQTTGGVARASRQVITFARALTDRTITFGPALPAPTVSAVTPGAPNGRMQAQGTLPTEYNAGISFDITQTSTARFATLQATRGFLGAGNAYSVQLPDLSSAIGWDSNFAIRGGIATNWWVSGGGPVHDYFDGRYIFATTRAQWTGALTGVTAPAEGATYLMARVAGNTTP